MRPPRAKEPVPAERHNQVVSGYELALQLVRKERNDYRSGYEASRKNFIQLTRNALGLESENESLRVIAKNCKCKHPEQNSLGGLILPPGSRQ